MLWQASFHEVNKIKEASLVGTLLSCPVYCLEAKTGLICAEPGTRHGKQQSIPSPCIILTPSHLKKSRLKHPISDIHLPKYSVRLQ